MSIIEKLIAQPSFRPPGAPLELNHNGYIFKYVKYKKSVNQFKYICQFGYDRHKKRSSIQIKCPAYIHVSFNLIKNIKGEEDVKINEITIMNENHICKKETYPAEKYITDLEIKSSIEQIYTSQNPRPTQSQIITQLVKQYDNIHIPERIVYNTFTKLQKENKKKDDDFDNSLKTYEEKNFELFKYRFFNFSEGINKYIICYCSKFQYSLIDQSLFIFIDGTFDIAPNGFAQVLVMLGRTQHMNIPLCYILLPSKEQKIYELAFTMFMTSIGKQFLNGTTFITDFEKGLSNAVKKVLMNETHIFQYCYFHYTQIMKRYFDHYEKFQFLDKLRYITNLFPFITEPLLNEVLNTLSQFSITDTFSNYFTRNFKNRYNFKEWNVSGKTNKQIITNNVAESHNSKLNRRIKEGPTLENFETIIKDIEKENRALFESKSINNVEINRIDEDTFLEIFKNFITDLERGGFKKITHDNESLEKSNSNFSFNNLNIIQTDQNVKESNNTDLLEINEIEKDKNLKLLKKASNINKISINKIPEVGLEILRTNLIAFKSAPERSANRKNIILESYRKVQELEPGIELNQIKAWFNNHKNKV